MRLFCSGDDSIAGLVAVIAIPEHPCCFDSHILPAGAETNR